MRLQARTAETILAKAHGVLGETRLYPVLRLGACFVLNNPSRLRRKAETMNTSSPPAHVRTDELSKTGGADDEEQLRNACDWPT
jgi:hypothetical protein